MLPAIIYLTTLSPLSIFSSLFPLLAENWLYGVIIHLVRLTHVFATEDHNMNMFSKIATFLQNPFIKTLWLPHFELVCSLYSGVYARAKKHARSLRRKFILIFLQ